MSESSTETDGPERVSAGLASYDAEQFTHNGETRWVFRRGSGPAVIVIAEIPGLTPRVLRFAAWVEALGCTVVLPHLFGPTDIDYGDRGEGGLRGYVDFARTFAGSFLGACVRTEFVTLATGRTSPVVDWLRALAADSHRRCGGPGVGAVGMCFTGGFALAMATDERLLVPVVSQPSLPLAKIPGRADRIDLSPEDLATVKGRCANGLEVIGLRFHGDPLCPSKRFRSLERELGSSFIAVELDPDSADPHGQTIGRPHSVLTEGMWDEPGQPTRAALDLVLDHLRRKLVEA